MRRVGMTAVVLLGIWTMADHALSGQDLNRFTRTITVNGQSFPVLTTAKARRCCCFMGSLTTISSGATR
jgi:hypothetical protein